MEIDMAHTALKENTPPRPAHKRRRAEQTLLYQIVERHYPAFRDIMAALGKALPLHVQQEFSDYLKCGRLEHGFLRVQCAECHQGTWDKR